MRFSYNFFRIYLLVQSTIRVQLSLCYTRRTHIDYRKKDRLHRTCSYYGVAEVSAGWVLMRDNFQFVIGQNKYMDCTLHFIGVFYVIFATVIPLRYLSKQFEEAIDFLLAVSSLQGTCSLDGSATVAHRYEQLLLLE